MGINISRNYELRVSLDAANHVTAVWERPLSWVHATLVRSRGPRSSAVPKAPLLRVSDCRIKVIKLVS